MYIVRYKKLSKSINNKFMSFKVKGLLPDEEKEKIGPKNVSAKGNKINIQNIISSKPQSNSQVSINYVIYSE